MDQLLDIDGNIVFVKEFIVFVIIMMIMIALLILYNVM